MHVGGVHQQTKGADRRSPQSNPLVRSSHSTRRRHARPAAATVPIPAIRRRRWCRCCCRCCRGSGRPPQAPAGEIGYSSSKNVFVDRCRRGRRRHRPDTVGENGAETAKSQARHFRITRVAKKRDDQSEIPLDNFGVERPATPSARSPLGIVAAVIGPAPSPDSASAAPAARGRRRGGIHGWEGHPLPMMLLHLLPQHQAQGA